MRSGTATLTVGARQRTWQPVTVTEGEAVIELDC